MEEGNDNPQELSFREKIFHFSKTGVVKEVVAVHSGILLIASLIYLFSSLVVTGLFLVASLILEMFCFHVIWIYRDNKNKRDRPLMYAILKEVTVVLVSVIGILGFILINNLIYSATGVAIFIPVSLICALLFFAYSTYTVYDTKVRKDDIEDLD